MATQTGSIDLKALKASSDIAVTALEQSVEYIVGTQTATTASWTGVTTDSALKAGKTIAYKLTQTSAANATLNLTLAGGGTTGAKAVYYNTARVGTHYPKDSVVMMTYNGTDWRITNYNSDTVNRTRLQNVIKAAAAITSGRIICGTASGYQNIAANVAFDLSYPLLYAGSTLAANATGDNNYLQINGINASSNGTITSGTNYKQLYLKGKVSGKTFTIAASPFLTTVEPTSDDGYCYIPLGMFYNSTTNIYFNSTNKLFGYRDGMFGELSLREASAAAKTATNFLSTDSSGIMIYDGKNGVQTPSNPSADTKNVFIDSDSVDVRKGTTVLATFGADGSRIGKPGEGYVETLADGIVFGDDDGEHIKMGLQHLEDAEYPLRYVLKSKDPVFISHTESFDPDSTAIADSILDERLEDAQGNLITFGQCAVRAATLWGLYYSQASMMVDGKENNSVDHKFAEIAVKVSQSGTGTVVETDTSAIINADIVFVIADHVKVNSSPVITKQTFSATSLSASAYYLSRTFNIAKTGYTPIAVNVRTNQAAIYCASADYSNPASASVTVGHRTASSISGLNLYLDVTYVRNELI